jgi:hypothetical protein
VFGWAFFIKKYFNSQKPLGTDNLHFVYQQEFLKDGCILQLKQRSSQKKHCLPAANSVY